VAGFDSILQAPFCYVPRDVLVPGALTVGDLSGVAAALAPRPLRIEGLVDGLNHVLSAEPTARSLEPVRSAYQALGAGAQLRIMEGEPDGRTHARWLVQQLPGN
jgi:hypothetical protein